MHYLDSNRNQKFKTDSGRSLKHIMLPIPRINYYISNIRYHVQEHKYSFLTFSAFETLNKEMSEIPLYVVESEISKLMPAIRKFL